jgi:hypothetical protein
METRSIRSATPSKRHREGPALVNVVGSAIDNLVDFKGAVVRVHGPQGDARGRPPRPDSRLDDACRCHVTVSRNGQERATIDGADWATRSSNMVRC